MYQMKSLGRNTPGFAGASGKVLQKKSDVENIGQTYNYDTDTVTVGKSMRAWLDPKDLLKGQSANLNIGQTPMMNAIRKYWNIKGVNVVKGHLLNDNLGGTANNNNLYPITGGANKNHLNYVENAVKERVWNDELGIFYKVKVDAVPDISESRADFDCEMREWNPKNGKVGALITDPVTIPSDLEDVRSKEDDSFPFLTFEGEEAESVSRPKKPKGVPNPKTRVSELTSSEADLRDMDIEN